MPPVAPWETDGEQVNTLTQPPQSKVECSALPGQITKNDEEVFRFRKAREDAETRVRYKELRTIDLETKASKALEGPERERTVSRSLQDSLDHEKDEVAKAAKAARCLEPDFPVAASGAALEERLVLLEPLVDLKTMPHETEIARPTILATDADSLRSKVAKLERDLRTAQNDTLASEQRGQREREKMAQLLEMREIELAELRFSIQDAEVNNGLRKQLEEKNIKLGAIRNGISSLEGRLLRRIGEIEANIDERKQRAAAAVALSLQNLPLRSPPPTSGSDRLNTSPLGRFHTSISMPADKWNTLTPSDVGGSSTSAPWGTPSLASHTHSGNLLEPSELRSSVAGAVARAEYDALYKQCLELEKRLEERDTVLQAEREAASNVRRESSILKAELEDSSRAQSRLRSQLEVTRTALHDAQTRMDGSEEDIRQLSRRLATFEVSDEQYSPADLTAVRSDELASIFSTAARLRSERDDALRTLSFLEEESICRLGDVESQLRDCTAHSSNLESDLAEATAEFITANQTMTSLRQQNKELAAEGKRLQTLAMGIAILFQHLDNQGKIMANELHWGTRGLIQEDEPRIQGNLELERTYSHNPQKHPYHPQQALAMCLADRHDASRHEECVEPNDFLNVEELVLAPSAGSCAVDIDDIRDRHQFLQRSERRHLLRDSEEPSFSETTLGHNLLHPASPPRPRDNSQTLASSNAHGGLPQPRLSLCVNTPPDLHVGCREQLNELHARIERRNGQIGAHQAEIARLAMNLTLAEEANAEHMAEWDKLNAERNRVVLECDAMVADCAEAREARNAALRRSDVLEEEIDSLRADIITLQDQISASSFLHESPPSCYTAEQVTALVKEVISAAGRAQYLEGSLAEAHSALTEACELEGHLAGLQAKRDELAVELEATQRENDRITLQIDAKEQKICQMQDALAAAQSEASAACSQRDVARDEIRSLREDHDDERQRLTVLTEELRRQAEDAHAQNEFSRQQSEAKIQGLSDALHDTEEASLAARVRNEATERDLCDAKIMLQQQVDLLTVRCGDLELRLQAAVESAQRESSERSQDLALLRVEKDQAVLAATEARASLKSAETAASERIAHAEVTIEELTSGCRQVNTDLESARNVISELEQSLKAAKDDLITRADELRRVNGMKRFLEMDVRKREAELAQLTHERTEARVQVEQFRDRSHATEISNGTEKARMAKEIDELRHELELVAAARDDAICQAHTAEDRFKTVMKTQRKNELQVNMLKEKLRMAPLRHDASPNQREIIQQPASRTVSGSWRRPALLSQRNPPGSKRSSFTGPSDPRIPPVSLTQPAGVQLHSKTFQPTRDPRNASATPLGYCELTNNNEPNPGSAQAHASRHALSSTGKRKREIEADAENRRPPEVVVVPMSHPSRMQQIAERGLRKLSPKRPPHKKPDLAEGPDSATFASSALAKPPFDIPNQHGTDTESSQIRVVPNRLSLRSSQEQALGGGPPKPRVRLQEMLTSVTNVELR